MSPEDDVEDLLRRAEGGDGSAREQLLTVFRGRLRQMVAVRLDRRVVARVDPSDVVQEALTEAAAKMSDYLQRRPLPFYPWLWRLTWECLIKQYRLHIVASKRSVTREQEWSLPDESAHQLARLLPAAGVTAPGNSPSEQVMRQEQHDRVRAALDRLPARDREVLVLRYLDQLSTAEIAAVLDITAGAVKVRHLRALERIRILLTDTTEDPS